MRVRKLRKIALFSGIFLPIIVLLIAVLTGEYCSNGLLWFLGSTYFWEFQDFIYYHDPAIADHLILTFFSVLFLLFYFYTSEKIKLAISSRRLLYICLLYIFYVIAIEIGISLLIFITDFFDCFSFVL